MANEIQVSYSAGKTVYALVRNSVGQIWNGSAFTAYLTANYSLYTISLTEQGSASGWYVGNFPTSIPAGTYSCVAKAQQGGSAAETDPTIAGGNIEWNGSAVAPLSDLATSGQVGTFAPIRLARGVGIPNFSIYLKSSLDHVTPFVSGVVSGQIARDGGSFGALQSGSFSEVGLGFFTVPLTSGDLLGNVVRLVFTANGISGGSSDPLPMSFILQRTSGQL